MGTLWTVTLFASDEAKAKSAAAAAFRRVAELDARFSDYAPDSELSMLRYANAGIPVKLSADLFAALMRAQDFSEFSKGAFDATVGPFVRLWRTARKSRILPSPLEIGEAARAVGWRKVSLDARAQTVTLAVTNMRLDLGGIGKGIGADAALAVLKQHGVNRALVAASGDIAVGDPPPGKPGWSIGIAALDEEGDALTKLVYLRNCGVSTSGDTEQFVVIGGVRYSHVVDPATGIGLTHRIQSTVIARDATTSDAMGKVVSVQGVEQGLKLVEKLAGVSALVITKDGQGTKRFESKRFRELKAVPK